LTRLGFHHQNPGDVFVAAQFAAVFTRGKNLALKNHPFDRVAAISHGPVYSRNRTNLTSDSAHINAQLLGTTTQGSGSVWPLFDSFVKQICRPVAIRTRPGPFHFRSAIANRRRPP